MDLHSLAIGIATRNRWEDLAETLAILKSGSLKYCRIYLIDDSSDTACPEAVRSQLHTYCRNEFRLGYIEARNTLGRTIQEPYYLSLDDDSAVIAGDVAEALDYLENNPFVAVLAFPIDNPGGKWQTRSTRSSPYQTQAFVGCGHIHRLSVFRELGGYRSLLVHQAEEIDYGTRALMAGYQIHHYPRVRVLHRTTSAARDRNRILFYESRNKVLWNDWYLPLRGRGWWLLRSAVGRVIRFMKTRKTAVLKGYVAGLREAPRLADDLKMPLTKEDHKRWRALPFA